MANKFYGSVNSQAELVTDLYGSGYILSSFSATVPQSDSQGSDMEVTAVDSTIITPLINSNSNARGFMNSGWDSGGEIILFIESVRYITIQLKTSEGSTYLVYRHDTPSWGQIKSILEDNYGITLTGDFTTVTTYVKVTMPISPTIVQNAQRITKLYGSANGQTKLIHQGFGHYDHGYGEVTYYSNSGHTTIAIGTLRTQEEVDSLSWTSPTATNKATIDGVEVERSEIKEVKLFNKVLSIPRSFSAYCSNLEKCDISNTGITAIPSGFLSNASTFNSEIILPSTVTSIGDGFMLSCLSFNQNLALPANLTSIGVNFLSTMRDMVSEVNVGSLSADIITYSDTSFMARGTNAPSYTTGIKIAGANRSAWIAKFPNESDPYARKLVNAGH